jgi:serine acetyltransferase/O-antigen/teichoic acid export membrane protein
MSNQHEPRSDWEKDRARYDRTAWLTQPSLWAIAVYRFGRRLEGYPSLPRQAAHGLYFVAYSVVRLITGIDIPRGARIGGGLMIHHFGGVVIHPRAVIGTDCTMRHGVTVGARDASGPPVVGNRVTIGAYAQLLGSVDIGDDCRIGAMSVVLADVSPCLVSMVRLPARQSRTWAFAAQGVVALTGLISITLIARLLGPADFGLYYVAFTSAAVLGIILDSCVGQAILTKSPGYETSWRSWRRDSVGIASLGSISAVGVASLLANSADLLFACCLLAVSIPMTVASMVPRARILLSGDVRAVALTDSFVATIANSAATAVVYWTGSLWGAAFGGFLLAMLRLTVLNRLANRRTALDSSVLQPFRLSVLHNYWQEMSGTYQSQLIGFLSRTADNLIVAFLLGPFNLAQYSRAFSFVIGPAQQAQMALTPTAIRDLASAAAAKERELITYRLAFRLFALILPGVVVLSISGPTIAGALLGEGWELTGELMRLSVGLAMSTVLAMPARWFLLSGRNNRALRIDSYVQLSVLASVAVGALVAGVVGSLIASSFIAAPIATFVVWRLTGTRLYFLYLKKLLPFVVGILAVAVLVAVSVVQFDITGLWMILILTAAAILVSAVSWQVSNLLLKGKFS